MGRAQMQRLALIRQTAEQLASEKADAKAARLKRQREADRARYTAKIRQERTVMAETRGSPYERVVKRIERLTGVPASAWEHDSRHAYTKRAVEAAQRLAGIDTTRTVLGRAA